MSPVALAVVGIGAFLAAGVAMFAGALSFAWRDYRRSKTWPVADGVIVKYVEMSDIDGTYLRTVVEFTDASGQVVHARSSWGSSPARYKIGTAVKVCYPAHHPQRAQIIGENLWTYAALGSFGLLAAVLCAALIRHVLRHGVTVG